MRAGREIGVTQKTALKAYNSIRLSVLDNYRARIRIRRKQKEFAPRELEEKRKKLKFNKKRLDANRIREFLPKIMAYHPCPWVAKRSRGMSNLSEKVFCISTDNQIGWLPDETPEYTIRDDADQALSIRNQYVITDSNDGWVLILFHLYWDDELRETLPRMVEEVDEIELYPRNPFAEYVIDRIRRCNWISPEWFPAYLAQFEFEYRNRNRSSLRMLAEYVCKFVPHPPWPRFPQYYPF